MRCQQSTASNGGAAAGRSHRWRSSWPSLRPQARANDARRAVKALMKPSISKEGRLSRHCTYISQKRGCARAVVRMDQNHIKDQFTSATKGWRCTSEKVAGPMASNGFCRSMLCLKRSRMSLKRQVSESEAASRGHRRKACPTRLCARQRKRLNPNRAQHQHQAAIRHPPGLR